jgi:hypothetical protein
MQAAQVRKNGYVPEPDVNYQPDLHNYCSVYAGTMVQQVPSSSACSAEILSLVLLLNAICCIASVI